MIDQVFLLEHFHQVIQACDGHDGSQLECPPHHYLHSQQAVTCPGGKSGDDHGGGSQVAVHHVQQRQTFPMSLRQHQLPDGESQEDGREDEIYDGVGNQYDAEQDDDEGQQHQGHIDDGGVTHLLIFQSDEETQEDDFQKPSHVDDEACAHLDEVAVGKGAYHHHDDGEESDANHVVEHFALQPEILASPFLRQQPPQGNVAQHPGDSEVHYEEHADEEDGSTTPFRVDGTMAGKGLVLGLPCTFGSTGLHRQGE